MLLSRLLRPLPRFPRACEKVTLPSIRHEHTSHTHDIPIIRGKSLDNAEFKTPGKPTHHYEGDHRTLGIDFSLFSTHPTSPGTPLFHPDGTHIFQKLQAFLRAQYPSFGIQEVLTPIIYKKSIWERSGHWAAYKSDMFTFVDRSAPTSPDQSIEDEDEEYGIKPMNCPGHCLLFQSVKRSYHDLPIRYADFSPLHRNEISGSLSGLTRLRRFHQDDGHIFCRPVQVGQEIESTLEFLRIVYEAFDLGNYQLVLSTRPKTQFIGTVSEWERAEAQLKTALEQSGRSFEIHEGDGAFYGPKIDVVLTDLDGKRHQTATIQLDFQLPRRFALKYDCPAPEQEADGIVTTDPDLLNQSGTATPVIIHRAVLGSLERFMALLIEQYRGHWPFWLSPRQMIILPVYHDPKIHEYVQNLAAELRAPGARHQLRALDARTFTVDVDLKKRSLAKKVGIAKAKRYNVICVIGNDDMETNMVSLSVYGEPNAKLRRDMIESIKPMSHAPPLETSHMHDGYFSVRLTRAECTALMMRFCDEYV